MRRKNHDELKMMFMAFAGGYILAKTGILDDPNLSKTLAEALKVWIEKDAGRKA